MWVAHPSKLISKHNVNLEKCNELYPACDFYINYTCK